MKSLNKQQFLLAFYIELVSRFLDESGPFFFPISFIYCANVCAFVEKKTNKMCPISEPIVTRAVRVLFPCNSLVQCLHIFFRSGIDKCSVAANLSYIWNWFFIDFFSLSPFKFPFRCLSYRCCTTYHLLGGWCYLIKYLVILMKFLFSVQSNQLLGKVAMPFIKYGRQKRICGNVF